MVAVGSMPSTAGQLRCLATGMRADIVPGARFPDFDLPDHTRRRSRLSELQGDDPLILTLSRGHFCPKEHHQHRELAEWYPKLPLGYARIVTITTDDILDLNEFRQAVGAQWTFLSDHERTVQRDLEVQEYTDPWHDPLVPHTVVLAPGLVVHRVYCGYWYWGRPTVQELHVDLRAVTRACRPDWDLSAPGLRAQWEVGDLSRHWPYTPGGLVDLYPEVAQMPPAATSRPHPDD